MQYINLEKLKPALESIEDFPVETLEAILGLVEENDFEDRSPEIEELKAQIETLNTAHADELANVTADFETRFRNAFFKGVDQGEVSEPDVEPEADPEDITIEALLEDLLGEDEHEE